MFFLYIRMGLFLVAASFNILCLTCPSSPSRRNLFAVCNGPSCQYAIFYSNDLQGACPVGWFRSY